MSNPIIWNYVIPKTIPFSSMACFMVYQCLLVCGREIVFCWHRVFLSYINPFFGYFILFGISKIFCCYS
ncbi:unknown [Prevotella sp. CAG:5226]|nr:unknown [Prevotella sp. CAG:5226]